jgi:purine-binding chemotaxis protein CheW
MVLRNGASTESTTEALPGATSDAGEQENSEHGGALHALGNSADAPRLLVFTAAGRTCACELTAVREIIPHRRATRLPGAPSFAVGLINLRGSIVTVLDLGIRLGGHAVDVERGSIVLVDHGSRVVGLAVDELRDVQRVWRSSIEPADGEAGQEGFVRGMLRAAGEVAALLDVSRIVADALGSATYSKHHSPEQS